MQPGGFMIKGLIIDEGFQRFFASEDALNDISFQSRIMPGIKQIAKSVFSLIVCLLFIGTISAQQIDLDELLTSEEKEWLAQNRDGTIRYAPNQDWPPGEFVQDGVEKGIVPEYVAIFEHVLGMRFERIYLDSWSAILEGLKNGTIDLVGGIHITEDRRQFLNFTQSFLDVPLGIVVKDDASSTFSYSRINRMTLACVRDYATIPFIRENYPSARIVPAGNDLLALLETSLGRTDGSVIDLMTVSYLVDKYSITNLKYGVDLDFEWNLGFAASRKVPHLISILDKVLNTINEEERKRIYSKWVNIDAIPLPDFFSSHLDLIKGLSFLIVSLLLGVLVFSRVLVIRVNKKTRELRNARDEAQRSEEYIRKRLGLEQMLARIAESAVGNTEVYKLINLILADVGSTIDVSRAYIIEHRYLTETMDNTYEWCNEGITPEIGNLQGVPSETVQWWLSEMLKGKEICYQDIEDIPDEGAKNILRPQGILSILVVPLFVKGKYHGFMGFDECTTPRDWPDEDVYLLKSVAHILTSLLERHESEEALRIKDRAIESSITGIALADMEANIVYVNPAFVSYWGYSSAEEILKINGFQIWKSRQDAEKVYTGLMAHGSWYGELEARRADGSLFTVELNLNLVNDYSGRPVNILASIMDITDRKRWEEQLIEAKEVAEQNNRLKSAFLANLSHEIRTPMNGILGFLDLVQDMDLRPDERADYVNYIKKSGQRLLDTVTDIIEMSKIEAGEILVRFEETDPYEIQQYLLDFYKPQALEKSISLQLENRPECKERMNFKTDRFKLEAVLANLISNAIKFTESGGVVFGCFPDQDMITFYVRDTGLGIPVHLREQIFDRFVQADTGYGRWKEGSGLGLSIAKAYVEKLGGHITLESAVGAGSTFMFSLPLKY
jgi:PAS domain S-box-containing protein